ncbi:MAG: hypothetical protein LQ343_004106 [Gyalolechia ehrenbergii]|nr:MAG: hypothetical protein LQ343_004106 [Gyalolechia ehrenbergii]
MKQTFSVIVLTCYLALQVTAFPHLEKNMLQDLIKREAGPQGCPFARDAAQQKKKRQLGFDPVAQHVSTTGEHAFAAPNLAAGDKRGPCPGLNALANHGYLPHNGIAPATTIVQAVTEVYGMAIDLAAFLAQYGTAFDGDAVSLTPGYSIGGPSALGGILGGTGILRTPSGLTGSHNNYEADTSSTRGDLYLTGNNDLLQMVQFQQYYDALLDDTPAPEQYSALFRFRQGRFNDSIENNPYFFFPQFAGVLVAPAGYAFPPAMMSNKSAQYPQGYLDKETFKSFFAVSGEPGSFTYQPGYERIPDNFYKRAVGDEYSIPDYLADILQFARQDPRLLSIGGNTGNPNTFTGISLTDFTYGVYNSATLAQGNNLQCFTFQLIQAEAPGLLTGVYEDVTQALGDLFKQIDGALEGLGCPQLEAVDTSFYGQYPGYGRAGGV